MESESWAYLHADLGEPSLPDGSPIRRPVVRLGIASISEDLLAVVDSGSPISVADASLFRWLGVNIVLDRQLYEVPLGLGSGFGNVPIFEVELTLRPPPGVAGDPISWRMHLGARKNWRLPFAVLLGQRGWFDRFPTTIDAGSTTVQLVRQGRLDT